MKNNINIVDDLLKDTENNKIDWVLDINSDLIKATYTKKLTENKIIYFKIFYFLNKIGNCKLSIILKKNIKKENGNDYKLSSVLLTIGNNNKREIQSVSNLLNKILIKYNKTDVNLNLNIDTKDKFKVGDRVEVVEYGKLNHHIIGAKGVVDLIYDNNLISVQLDKYYEFFSRIYGDNKSWIQRSSLKQWLFDEHEIKKIDYNEKDSAEKKLTFILRLAKNQYKPYDQITNINISRNGLTDLEGIENLINLQNLNCSNNQLTNLNGIENLINLKSLVCSNNQLTNLNGIENLRNLELLSCYDNQLTNLNGIENLINLEMLWCSNNQLTNLNGIENFKNLKLLDCRYNNFSNSYKEYLREYCESKNIRLKE